jgi:hypothetical protein
MRHHILEKNGLIHKPTIYPLAALVLSALLAACSHDPQGVRFVNGSSKPQPQPIRTFSAGEIQQAISGKTFQYTRSDGSGFITYSGDGTFSYQDDAKGAGKGTWSVSNGQFCETYGSTPQDCGIFKSTGDAYFAAQSRLVEMKS